VVNPRIDNRKADDHFIIKPRAFSFAFRQCKLISRRATDERQYQDIPKES